MWKNIPNVIQINKFNSTPFAYEHILWYAIFRQSRRKWRIGNRRCDQIGAQTTEIHFMYGRDVRKSSGRSH